MDKLVRNAGRFQEVVSVIVRYGLAPWLSNVPLDWVQRQFRNDQGQPISGLSEAERLRMALTELGTTFVKLGQVLSTRVDLVGPEIADELAKLQSDTPADSPEAVAKMVEAELGASPDQLFRQFDLDAFASASIGQVHRAKLQDGTDVVVKVQHAGIGQRIETDLEILIELAKLAEKYSQEASQYQPVATAVQFRKTLLRELDFQRERDNLTRFAANFSEEPGVRFPRPATERSTAKVLTMDCFTGISLSDKQKLVASGYDLEDIARRGADLFIKMVFRDGFYHADPHPGNLMVLEGEVIGVLDCGMVGGVDEDLREQVEDLLMAAIDRDTDRLLDATVELGEVPPSFDRGMLRGELVEFVDEYGSVSMNDFDLGGALTEMTDIIRRHRILLPPRVSLLIKMLIMLEGTSRQLSPDFNLVELLEPYRGEAIKRRLSPQRMWKKLQSAHRDWSRLAESFPGDVSDIMTRVRRGSFDVHLEHRRLDKIVNRIVLGVLTAALFMGSTALLSNEVAPSFRGTSIPGAIGAIVAVYFGFTLVRAIKRSGDLG